MRWIYTILLLLLSLSVNAAEEKKSDLDALVPDAPPLAPVEPIVEKRRANLFGTLNDQHLLLIGLRMDAAYSGGGATTQGFSIPSVRLTAWGQAGDLISYRFSMGQAREFTSILLPTLIPVQAYIDFNSASAMDWDPKSRMTLRMGLFTPTYNPWWSPDLAEITLPDYNETHRALFVNRDIGAEVIYEPIAGHLMFFAGGFNGSGIFSANTNNSRTFTGGVLGTIPIGSAKWAIGFSSYLRTQADSTNINYRADLIGNVYTSLELPESRFKLTAELFGGELNDSTRTAYPIGAAGSMMLPLFSAVRLFTRAEFLANSGTGTGYIRNAQVGPVLELHKTTHAYLIYQYLDTSGSIENMGWLRVRLVL